MINKMTRLISRALCAAFALVMIVSSFPVYTRAADSDDPFIVVSMGDSYSAGEGVKPFYGYSADRDPYELIEDEDWLAHRSERSWPGKLRFQEAPLAMSNYRPENTQDPNIKWYFVAASGAVTADYRGYQKREYDREMSGLTPDLEGETELPPQLLVYTNENLRDKVDYVTMTIGGNDVGFTGIVEAAFKHNAHIHLGSTANLEDKFTDVWEDISNIISNLAGAYQDVRIFAGEQAEIIVAGYPRLFDEEVIDNGVNRYESRLINSNVSAFNALIKDIVTTLAGKSTYSTMTEHHQTILEVLEDDNIEPGSMKIHFVDVEEKFLGHGARSLDAAGNNDEWIHGIILFAYDEDLDHDAISSSFSVHPNPSGAEAYAECVNAKIREIEAAKAIGFLSGKVCKASDRTTPVTDATISVVASDHTTSIGPDQFGNYTIGVPEGAYELRIGAPGYIDFKAYVGVRRDETTYTETFLLIDNSGDESGVATGKINNALNGAGIGDVRLDVREGWSNGGVGDIIQTVYTDSSGNYSVTLPLGNYTLCATKDGYISTSTNIIVQGGTTSNQNATMAPNISGDNYRIVLKWGENPSDLDSHVVGTLSNGNSFHVYYSHKSQYDGDVEVCNLDIDDTTSYGPETITLNATNSKPYYYYIYRYSGSGTVASSGAQIKVYQGETEIATFNVPPNLGSGDYWNVFAIVDGQLVIRNTLTSSAETGYASSAISTFSLRAPRVEEHPVYDDSYPAKDAEVVDVTEPTEEVTAETEPEATEQEEMTEVTTIPESEPTEEAEETEETETEEPAETAESTSDIAEQSLDEDVIPEETAWTKSSEEETSEDEIPEESTTE